MKKQPWSLVVRSSAFVGLPLSLVLIVLAGAVKRPESPREISLLKVTCEDFSIPVETAGRVEPKYSTVVQSDCRWNTYILSIIPEGTWVQEGDVVCELDPTDIEESLRNWEVPLINARASLDGSVQEELLQRSAGERALARAQFQLQSAENDFEQYQHGTYPQQVSQLEQDLELTREQLTQAESEYSQNEQLWAQGLVSDRVLDQTEYERDEKLEAVRRLEARLSFLKGMQHDRSVTQKDFQARLARREVLRTEISNAIAETSAHVNTLMSERRMLIYRRYREYARKGLEACTIRAPRSGQVIYASSWNERRTGSSPIGCGSPVYYQQALFEIPEQKHFKVSVPLHESLITKVQCGMAVEVRLKGYEQETLTGVIGSISQFPKPRSYFAPDVRDFMLEVNLTPAAEQEKLIRLNMDAEVTLQLSPVKDALTVPCEAVVGAVGQNFVWRMSGVDLIPQPVQLGESDDKRVCIVAGLAEGDRIAVDLSDHQRAALEKHRDRQLQIAQR